MTKKEKQPWDERSLHYPGKRPVIQLELHKVHHGIKVQRIELKFSVFHEEPSFLFLCFLTAVGIGNLILIRKDKLVITF